VKQYEGLFILNTAGKVEGADEVLAQVTEVINGAGGKVTGEIEKLDSRPFAQQEIHFRLLRQSAFRN